MVMTWLKKAPTSLVIAIIVVVGVATVAYLAGYVYLTASGADTTDYRGLLNTGFNYVGILFGGTAAVASVSAARSASNAEDQTNGLHTDQLTKIANQAAAKALEGRLGGDRDNLA